MQGKRFIGYFLSPSGLKKREKKKKYIHIEKRYDPIKTHTYMGSNGGARKHGNSTLAGCLQGKFPKVFIQTFIYKIDGAIKMKGHRY